MTSFFESLLGLRKISDAPCVYQNTAKLEKMGNALPIAYGGLLQAQSLLAAYHSLPGEYSERSKWVVYSVTGHFLGPTSLHATAEYRVERLRDTRTFATRSIVVSQVIDGKRRNTFSATVDFTVRLPDNKPLHNRAELPLEYTAKPSRGYPPPADVPYIIDLAAEQVRGGTFDEERLKSLSDTFQLGNRVSKLRLMEDQTFAKTLMGFNIGPQQRRDNHKDRAGEGVTEMRQADWIKANEAFTEVIASSTVLPLSVYILQAAFLLFIGDEALSFLPLLLHGLSIADGGATSTLDFSVRFLSDDFDFEQYHLREARTTAARHERTFSESMIWDLSGRLVASISQSCIARPKPNL
ncbi:hypothetical protein CBS101457_006948 [Exobasidium rhododendri]|nr:hypothetical protein CBS101457_006948 [Exobasidium rhododendri]